MSWFSNKEIKQELKDLSEQVRNLRAKVAHHEDTIDNLLIRLRTLDNSLDRHINKTNMPTTTRETKTMRRSDPAVTEHLVVNSDIDLATSMIVGAIISDAGWTSSCRDSTFSDNDSSGCDSSDSSSGCDSSSSSSCE